MSELVDRLRDSLQLPASYISIERVVEHNRCVGLRETGGEFVLNQSLSFIDIPNESLQIIDEILAGDYSHIQNLIKTANDLRTYMRDCMGDTTDSCNLGGVIAELVLLREFKEWTAEGITPSSFFEPYKKLFSGTYNTHNSLTFPEASGTYHTHPYGLSEDKPIGMDLVTELPTMLLEFPINGFEGTVNLHLINPQESIYSFRLDTKKRQYEEK